MIQMIALLNKKNVQQFSENLNEKKTQNSEKRIVNKAFENWRIVIIDFLT